MSKLTPEEFFDLSSYKHARIFDHISAVWEVLAKISQYLLSQTLGSIETSIPAGAFVINPEQISIGSGTVIEPGCYIKGPCIIGKNCVVRHGAYIRGNLLCGDHCVVGHDTEVKNAIFLDHAHASHFAYVGDSILGNHVNLGAGAKCANLKFDQSAIVIHHEGKTINTNLRKLGAILGDHTQIGCNSVTNPGTILGKNVFCYPCINVGGVIQSNSFIKNSAAPKVVPAESR